MTSEQRQLLKSQLKANRWTLNHLAERAEISASYISLIINNRLQASPKTLRHIAHAASDMTGTEYIPSDFDLTNTTTEN